MHNNLEMASFSSVRNWGSEGSNVGTVHGTYPTESIATLEPEKPSQNKITFVDEGLWENEMIGQVKQAISAECCYLSSALVQRKGVGRSTREIGYNLKRSEK